MSTHVEDLEIIVDLEKIEKKLFDSERKISDLKEYHDKLVERSRTIESRPAMTVGTIEELKELLAPKPPDLSNLTLYESANFELTGYTESEPLQISDEDVEAEVERQLEQWRATLDPADQAILRGQGDLSAIASQEDCKENKEVKPLIVDSNEQFQSNGRLGEDAISMDIELTAEVPKGMIVTPVTDIKTNRRTHALRSHQSDSVKRVRRSARF